MRYFNLACRFIKHNFFKLALTTILPAVFLAFAHNPALKFYTLLTLSDMPNNDFWDVVQGIALIADWRKMLLFIFMGVLFSVFISSAVGAIERRMRYGEFYESGGVIKFFLRKVNDNFLHVFKYVLTLILIFEALSVAEALLVYLWMSVLGEISMVVASCITAFVFSAVGLYIFVLMIFTLPNMTIRGYNLRQSLAASTRTFNRVKYMSVLVTLALTCLITILPLAANAVLVSLFRYSGFQVVNWVLSFAWYYLCCLFLPSYIYAAYFDAEDMERADIQGDKFADANIEEN